MSPLIFLIGLLFSGVGVFLIRQHQRFFENVETVSGTLIGIEEYAQYRDNIRRLCYGAVVEYVYDGRTYQFMDHNTLDMSKSYNIGQSITVCVSRANPTHARLKKHIELFIGSVFTLGGFVIMGVALYLNAYANMGFVALGCALLGFFGVFLIMKIRLGAASLDEVMTAFKEEASADKPPYAPPLDGEPDRYLLTAEDLAKEKKSSQRLIAIIRIIGILVSAGIFYLGWQFGQDHHNIQEKLYLSWGIMGLSGLAFVVSLFGLLRQHTGSVQ